MSETKPLTFREAAALCRKQLEEAEAARQADREREAAESACPDCAELQSRVERLEREMPCGHRKVDWDDSYGGCLVCAMIEFNRSAEQLLADCEEDDPDDVLAAKVRKWMNT